MSKRRCVWIHLARTQKHFRRTRTKVQMNYLYSRDLRLCILNNFRFWYADAGFFYSRVGFFRGLQLQCELRRRKTGNIMLMGVSYSPVALILSDVLGAERVVTTQYMHSGEESFSPNKKKPKRAPVPCQGSVSCSRFFSKPVSCEIETDQQVISSALHNGFHCKLCGAACVVVYDDDGCALSLHERSRWRSRRRRRQRWSGR